MNSLPTISEYKKSVFISYRRDATGNYFARAIKQALTNYGYDVFLDVDNLKGGAWPKQIRDEIKRRAHFLLLLTPNALRNCVENGNDWVLRECKNADMHRLNIVPIWYESNGFRELPNEIKEIANRPQTSSSHDNEQSVGDATERGIIDGVSERLQKNHIEIFKKVFDNTDACIAHRSFDNDIKELVNKNIPPENAPKEKEIPQDKEDELSPTLKKSVEGIVNLFNKQKKLVFFLGPGINFNPNDSNNKVDPPPTPNAIDLADCLKKGYGFKPRDLIGLPCEACPEKYDDRPEDKNYSDKTCPIKRKIGEIVREKYLTKSEKYKSILQNEQELLFAQFELQCFSQFIIKDQGGNDSNVFKKLGFKLREQYSPNKIQEFLATLAKDIDNKNNINNDFSQLIIVTTNYDTGLEQAFEKVELPIHVVYYSLGNNKITGFCYKYYDIKENKKYQFDYNEASNNIVMASSIFNNSNIDNATPIIIKLHGGVIYKNQPVFDAFVISETHKNDFFSNAIGAFPKYLKFYLEASNFVFLGYTANDVYLKPLLHYFFENKDNAYAFRWHDPIPDLNNECIFRGYLVSNLPIMAAGEMSNIEYWKHWGVEIIECSNNDFIDLFRKYLGNNSI